ncbi:MAG TPA: GNAT family N-acetyltransferase [Bryobacteraceae bacterium]|nr:GNAT family N-acetyltransferase [Bryobacteraceae bacterium]
MADVTVTNQEAENRFEAQVDGQTGYLLYKRSGDQILLIHTEVPPELEGKGIGSALARHAMEFARAEHLKVVPRCPFVAQYLKRHTEYSDLVVSRP